MMRQALRLDMSISGRSKYSDKKLDMYIVVRYIDYIEVRYIK